MNKNDREKEFEKWLDGRPDVIKEMARALKPWNSYRLKTTGQHCTIYSYSEDRTVTVTVSGHDDPTMRIINRFSPSRVFGINPDDLELIE